MRTNLKIFLVFFLALFSNAAWSADPVVTVRAVTTTEPVYVGAIATSTVELDILNPYHINANQPLEDYLIPTLVELQPLAGLEIEEIRYPLAEVKMFSFSSTPMAVYEGSIRVYIDMKASEGLIGKDVVLQGKVRYQACNDTMCLPEEILPLSIAFSVSEEAASSADLQADRPGSDPATEIPYEDTSRTPEKPAAGIGIDDSLDFSRTSLPVTLVLVFLGGLALNLTPCIYPMIPITITYFGGQSQGRKGSLAAHSCLYIIGMAVTYSALGVAAALTGGLFGAALQYPPVLLGIALVMVLLSLSMFEVYELRMPGFLNRLAGSNRKGFTGTVLMGMTVGIVAAPCVGPFVFGLLTYVGNSGNAFMGFLLFFVLSLGMGIPLLILGLFSGSIRRLPRSGEWMVWVRKVFGFILLAMAIFFLKTLFPHPLVYPFALALLFVLSGVYLAWIAPVENASNGFMWLRNIVGLGFFIAALFVAVTGLDAYLDNAAVFGFNSQSAVESPNRAGRVQWFPFSEAALESASLEGKPVLIDFYADWCAQCKEYDRQTFSDEKIVELSRNFLMVRADFTEVSDPDVEALRKRYDVPSLPTLIFLKPDGNELEDLRAVGFEPPDVFGPRMKEAIRISMDSLDPPVNETGI